MQDDPSDKAKVIALPLLILTGVLALGFVLDQKYLRYKAKVWRWLSINPIFRERGDKAWQKTA